MAKTSLLALLVLLMYVSCKKGKDNSCYKARFIADIPCVNTSVIQVTQPLVARLMESPYTVASPAQKTYEHAVMVSLPDEYKDGEEFFVSLESFEPMGIHDHWCAYPRYKAQVAFISKSACN